MCGAGKEKCDDDDGEVNVRQHVGVVVETGIEKKDNKCGERGMRKMGNRCGE